MNPKHELALALGARAGAGCECAVCGHSDFDHGSRGLGANFTDQDALVDPSIGTVCVGCERLLAGRPGDDPPPLRTRSVLLVPGTALEDLDRAAWWTLLTGVRPLGRPAVLSWATSRKRHHWLHAGVSTPDRWEVGTDHGPASWIVESGLAECVLELRSLGCRKAEIMAGRYPAHRLTAAISALDERLAPLRGHLILDLAVWAAPSEDLPEPPERENSMIQEDDARAAALLAEIAWRSSQRAEHGIEFWAANGFFVRRLRRFMHRDLRFLISRLMQECGVGSEAGPFLASSLGEVSEQQEAVILKALRDRTDLIAALAFDRVQAIRQERATPEVPEGF